VNDSIVKALAEIKQLEGVVPDSWQNLPWEEDEFSRFFLENEELDDSVTCNEIEFLQNVLSSVNTLPLLGRILDAGCGGGRTLKALSGKLGCDVAYTGIDIALPPLKTAVERIVAAQSSKTFAKGAVKKPYSVEFLKGQMTTMPFKNTVFDCVLSLFASWLSLSECCFERFLSEAFRVLKGGSVLVLEAPSYESLMALDRDQSWSLAESSFAGNFKQLILSENIVCDKKEIYIRKDYVVNLSTGKLKKYCQFYNLYRPDFLASLLENAGFSTVTTFGDFDCSVPDDDSPRLIIVAYK